MAKVKHVDLEAILGRVASASLGPWVGIDEKKHHHEFKFVKAPNDVIINGRGPNYARVILEDEDYERKSGDVAFVANSRTDIPEMIDEIEWLRANLARANKLVGWMMPYIGSMCPPNNGLFDLNEHCCDNIIPEPGDETKGAPLKQRNKP